MAFSLQLMIPFCNGTFGLIPTLAIGVFPHIFLLISFSSKLRLSWVHPWERTRFFCPYPALKGWHVILAGRFGRYRSAGTGRVCLPQFFLWFLSFEWRNPLGAEKWSRSGLDLFVVFFWVWFFKKLCLNGRYCARVTFVNNMLVKRLWEDIFLTKGTNGVRQRQEVRLEVRKNLQITPHTDVEVKRDI